MGSAIQTLYATTSGSRSRIGSDGKWKSWYSASLTAGYHRPINDEYSWYVRGEFTHTGKTYTDEFNQSWIGAANNVNLRAGVQGRGKRVEAYVTNVFDDNQWAGGRRGSTSIDPRPAVTISYPTVFVMAPRKRSLGIRASYEF